MKRTIITDSYWELTREEVSEAILEYVNNHCGDPDAIVGTSTIKIRQDESPNRSVIGATVVIEGKPEELKV